MEKLWNTYRVTHAAGYLQVDTPSKMALRGPTAMSQDGKSRISSASIIASLIPTISSAQLNISTEYVKRSVVFLYGSDNTGHVD